jgi:hypothetical protein
MIIGEDSSGLSHCYCHPLTSSSIINPLVLDQPKISPFTAPPRDLIFVIAVPRRFDRLILYPALRVSRGSLPAFFSGRLVILSCRIAFFLALPQSTLGTLAGLSSGVSHFHRLAGGPISGPSGSFVTGACLVDPNLSRTGWTVHDSAWYHFSQFRSFAFGAKPNCETAERPPQRKKK